MHNVPLLKMKTSRRTFLKQLAAAGAYAALHSCEKPLHKAISKTVQAEKFDNKQFSYANTFYQQGTEYATITTSIYNGNVIKIEGNHSPINPNGATSAKMQASLLDCYCPERPKYFLSNGAKTTKQNLISELNSHLSNGKAAFIYEATSSPAEEKLIETFCKHYNLARIAISSAPTEATNLACGQRATDIDLSQADTIVGVESDFLHSHHSHFQHQEQYSLAKQQGAQHIQVEKSPTLTGAKADKRITDIDPHAFFLAVKHAFSARDKNIDTKNKSIIEQLLHPRKTVLFLYGGNDLATAILCMECNQLANAIPQCISFSEQPIPATKADDSLFFEHADLVFAGKCKSAIFYKSNPILWFGNAIDWERYFENIEFSLAIDCYTHETANKCTATVPAGHFLESFADAIPQPGIYCTGQAVAPLLFDRIQAEQFLLDCLQIDTQYKDYIQQQAESYPIPEIKHFAQQQSRWQSLLEKGFTQFHTAKTAAEPLETKQHRRHGKPKFPQLRATASSTIGLHHGSANPYLQEVPESLTKIAWGNAAVVSQATANKHHLSTGDWIEINSQFQFPVATIPNTSHEDIVVYLGYGRNAIGNVAKGIGTDASKLISRTGNQRNYSTDIVRIRKIDQYSDVPFACMQTNAEPVPHDFLKKSATKQGLLSFHIDMDKCIGCNACTVACQSENNIPVVGKQDSANNRAMHWIKIDRYISEEGRFTFMPMLCQHCQNAPCETACPVSATTHSALGINQMTYNRCIGTRYCNASCPYQIRAFNWRDYTNADSFLGNTYRNAFMADKTRQLTMNPNVTLRSKGVIEKCSLCIQRIREAGAESLGSVKTACEQACNSSALSFYAPDAQKDALGTYSFAPNIDTLPLVHYKTNTSHD